MRKAAISSKSFLVEGGCNACGLKNTETFTIHFEDRRSSVLDHLDVSSLVTTIAQKNGWREVAIPVGIGEEEIVLKKADTLIQPTYVEDQVIYQSKDKRIQVNQHYVTPTLLFEEVNEILIQLFHIEPYQLAMAKE